MSEHQPTLAASPADWPRMVFAIALAFSTFQIVTAAFHPVSTQILRAVHVAFLLLLIFLVYPGTGKRRPGSRWPGCWAWLASALPHINGVSRLN